MAPGATRSQIAGWILSYAVSWAAIGLVLGVSGALVHRRFYFKGSAGLKTGIYRISVAALKQ